MLELIILGVLYSIAFIGITMLVLNGKDPNVLVVLLTGISTMLLPFINPKIERTDKRETPGDSET
jgi:hypothetical protein